MTNSSKSKSNSPRGCGVIVILLVVGIIGYGFYLSSYHGQRDNNVPTSTPTLQPTETVTATAKSIPTPSDTLLPPCYSAASDLTPFTGKTICVTGTLVKRQRVNIDQYDTLGERYFFSNSTEAFFVQYDNLYCSLDSRGDCMPVVSCPPDSSLEDCQAMFSPFVPISLPELGTCMRVTGTLMLNGDRIPFMEDFDTASC